jgi:hypothetical protein
MTINFEDLLPEGAKQAMIEERIAQLAAEGLANQVAKTEAEARNDDEAVTRHEADIASIISSIEANQAELI